MRASPTTCRSILAKSRTRLSTLRRLAQLAVDSIADLAQADTTPGADWLLQALPDDAELAGSTAASR